MTPEFHEKDRIEYSGPERRRDRARGVSRTMEEEARAIISHKFNGVIPTDSELSAAQFSGGEHVKRAVTRLSRLICVGEDRTTEHRKLLESLEDQAVHAASVWTKKFHSSQLVVSRNVIADELLKWLDTLPNRALDGLLAVCPDTARLVARPAAIPDGELLRLIGGKMQWLSGWNNLKTDRWICGVTDGREEVPFDEDVFYDETFDGLSRGELRINEQMVEEYARMFDRRGIELMPQHAYLPAQADAIARGEIMDRESFTAFRHPTGTSVLPFGCSVDDRVRVGGCYPDNANRKLRCRPWVGGELLRCV